MKTFTTKEVNDLLDECFNGAFGRSDKTLLNQFKKDKGLLGLEVGKWYKDVYDDMIIYITKLGNSLTAYGFYNSGEWFDERLVYDKSLQKNLTEATQDKVFQALKAEAIKRGFKEGVKFKALIPTCSYSDGLEGVLDFRIETNDLVDGCNARVFHNGTWATIIEQNTELQELEKSYKEIGKKIEALKNK